VVRIPRRRAMPALPEARAPEREAHAVPLRFALSKHLGSFSLRIGHETGSRRLALLGPSGAGKTLTLRLLAGLTEGEGESHVQLGDRALGEIPPERRDVGYVPQASALLPRTNVWKQVTFGARAQAPLAAWWLERLGLSGLEARFPEELSGGQRRRVALARALATAPRVLLLDEPLTGLDAPVRDELRRELRRLQREATFTSVIVTHDPEEAALLADEVIVLEDGHALQAGTREEVFRTPASPRVAALLGIVNTREGVVLAGGRLASAGAELEADTAGLDEGTEVVWCVRPERILLDPAGAYDARLLDDADLGAVRELTIALGNSLELTLRTSERGELAPSSPVRVSIAPHDITVWAAARAPIAQRP